MTANDESGAQDTPVPRKRKDVDMEVKFEYGTEAINRRSSGTIP